jgi:retron-type reverse transcriptase
MKRYGRLWESLVSWENLVLAARKAQRGKRDKSAVQRFNYGLEIELLRLHWDLSEGRYRPGKFRTHWIHRPKRRLISAAPYRDRVVHHALMNVLEPILDRHFHAHSYACRKGKGTHAAANRLQTLMRRNRFVLQCDVHKFFPSIDHEILKQTFRRLIKDPDVLRLMDMIVAHSNPQEPVLDYFPGDDLFGPASRRKGLPIGNLTSQWFANWMLNELDHWVTSHLGLGAYVRYCDDFVLLHDDRRRLKQAIEEIELHLGAMRLRLNHAKISVQPVSAGLTFLGYRIWPTHRLLKKDNVKGFRKRLRWMRQVYADGRIEWPEVKVRIDSWLGHARHADTRRLVRRLSKEWVFQRDEATKSCLSRR